MASRAPIAAAGDSARCRIERDLHDGVQQQTGLPWAAAAGVAGGECWPRHFPYLCKTGYLRSCYACIA
jgi:hypothetical protein